jgi:hypothetical protein
VARAVLHLVPVPLAPFQVVGARGVTEIGRGCVGPQPPPGGPAATRAAPGCVLCERSDPVRRDRQRSLRSWVVRTFDGDASSRSFRLRVLSKCDMRTAKPPAHCRLLARDLPRVFETGIHRIRVLAAADAPLSAPQDHSSLGGRSRRGEQRRLERSMLSDPQPRWATIMGTSGNATLREPRNKCKIVGQKAPFKLQETWVLRVRLQLDRRVRELALFNLGIDSKLRGCYLVALRVRDVCHGDQMATRAIVMQHKTQRPVQFEITKATRDALQAWIKQAGLRPEDFLFPSRLHDSVPLGTRQYARILEHWVEALGLDRAA